MSIIFSVSLLLGLPLVGVLLLLGVLGMIRELPELDGQGEPFFDESAALCNAPRLQQRNGRHASG